MNVFLQNSAAINTLAVDNIPGQAHIQSMEGQDGLPLNIDSIGDYNDRL